LEGTFSESCPLLDGDTGRSPANSLAERIRLSDIDSRKHGTDNLPSDWLRPKALWRGFISATGVSSVG